MDYTIVWTNSALEDLRDLVRYIAADDPIVAERFGNAIINGSKQSRASLELEG